MNENDKLIGSRIKHFRQQAGLTQTQLGEIIDMDPSSLGRCEIGTDRISLTRLMRISDALKIDLYKFFLVRDIEGNKKTIEKITDLLSTANDVQLGLIYNNISNLLDLTNLNN